MPFKEDKKLAAPAPAAAHKEPEAVIEATVERVEKTSATGPAPSFFTIIVEGLNWQPGPKQQGITGRQYMKGQFYPADDFLRNEWRKKKGTVTPYEGDPAVHKVPLHATPRAPWEWLEPETEEVPDLFTGEEEG